jgi:hypothetical protein
MKQGCRLGIYGAGLLGIIGVSSFAAGELPQPQAFAKYDAMLNRSPFAVASAPAALPAATPNFAKDLYVANVARTSNGDLVTIASSTDKNFKKYLNTKEPVEGYLVTGIEWSERVGQSKVTISKDGQFATLTFNQAVLAQPIPGAPQQPQPQQAGQPIQSQPIPAQPGTAVPVATPYANPANQNGTVIKPAPIPMLPTPPPRMRGVIQRNPDAQAQAQAQEADSAALKAGVQQPSDNE